MQISYISSTLLLTASVALAADCFGDKGEHPQVASAWNLRELMCGPDNGCGADGQTADCTLTLPITQGGVNVVAYRKDPSGAYKNCWGALENAINQCFLDKSTSYTGAEKKTQGNWKLGDEEYWINISTQDPATMVEQDTLQVPLVLGVDEDLSTPGGDYEWGPKKVCVGLSHGGGQGCIDVPAGCFVISTVGNVMPGDPICPGE